MKKGILTLMLLGITLGHLQAKENATYHFTKIFEVAADSVISQGKTGTCWSFSTTSFLESEIYRKTHHWVNLSEMYNVRMLYPRKLENYIDRQGKAQFGEGGLSHDVLIAFQNYGAVPEEAYSGLVNGASKFNHKQLATDLENLADSAVITLKARMDWRKKADSVLDKFMGQPPAQFQWEGKTFTPQSFAATLPISADDYVEFTSFGFQPYYSKFILNIPDNYNYRAYWNVPLDSFTAIINDALNKGYSVALDCDVTEKAFLRKPIQIAVFPQNSNVDFIHHIVPETWISPKQRDRDFQAYRTTDDHLMHIVGLYKDQLGNRYYKVKNSWGTDYVGKGYWMISLAYIRAKAIGIMVNKAAVDEGIAGQTFKNQNSSVNL